MVFYKLKIGQYDTEVSPLNPKKNEFEDCDKDGNVLVKNAGTYTKGTFYNKITGEEHTTAFKLIRGKAMAKLSKTKEVSNFKEVDVREQDDLIIEKEYLMKGDWLLKELKTTGKGLKFAYTSGNGYKVYFAYVKPHPIYTDYLSMVLGTTMKSELIEGLMKAEEEKAKVKTCIEAVGVDTAKVEDLLEL
jgi:hypothetical protein